MNDKETPIQDLKDLVKKFQVERNWAQFHDAKNLAEAISIEAGELLELFLWKNSENITEKIKNDLEYKEEVGEELADIFLFCINFANATDIDISEVVEDKLKKNAMKYPIEKAKNSAEKYTKL